MERLLYNKARNRKENINMSLEKTLLCKDKVNGNIVQIAFSDNNKTAENCITNVIKSIYK